MSNSSSQADERILSIAIMVDNLSSDQSDVAITAFNALSDTIQLLFSWSKFRFHVAMYCWMFLVVHTLHSL